jgi:adenylate cyclase
LNVGDLAAERLEGERRLVSVVFADLSGYTSLSERLDPEDIRSILSSFFNGITHEIQHFGGTIDKYIGDAVMAVFGAPVAHEDDAMRAIRSALAIQAVLTRQNDELQRRYGIRMRVRIGVNTGEVVSGLLGGEGQRAYTVTGDTVNTAQRLQSASQPGEILVGETTYQLARHRFVFEALPPLALKGKSEPVPAYRVLGVSDEALDRDAPPFVGREAELRRLQELLEEALRGRGLALHMFGEPGVGKSRLLHEFLSGVSSPAVIIRARCVSHEASTPYALIAYTLRRALGIVASDEAGVRSALASNLGRAAVSDESAADVVLEVLGYGQHSSLAPEIKRRLLVSLLRRLLRERSAQGGVVLIAEDTHWIDSASAGIMKELADHLKELRVLLISTSREATVPWASATMPVQALDESTAALLLDRAASMALDTELRTQVLGRTGGNPLFIAEVARNLQPQQKGAIPATIQELLAARLDRLDPGPRHVAQRASVIGRTFSTRILARITPDQRLEPALASLEREALFTPRSVIPEPTYAFRHALMQEVAYSGQLLSQRRRLHGEVAIAIEELYLDRIEESVDVLAFHYDQSDLNDKALHWLVRAATRAQSLFANDEAIAYFEKALRRAQDGEGPLDAATLLERIAEIQYITGRYDESMATLRSALDRHSALAPGTLARLHRRTGSALVRKSAFLEALAAYGQAKVALEGTGDSGQVEAARIGVEIGQLHWRQGSYAAAREALSRTVEMASAIGADDVVAEGLKHLGNVALHGGEAKEAADFFQRSRAIYSRLEDLNGIADVRGNLGGVYVRLGQWDKALAEFEAALALSERMGNPWRVGQCHNNIGEMHRVRGDVEKAIQAFERAIGIWAPIGYASGVGIALIGLGAAQAEAGDVDQGRINLHDAEARFSALGNTMYFPDLYRHLASAELKAGANRAAMNAARRSLRFARVAKARHQEAMTQRVLGQIALARGKTATARTFLEASAGTLAELGESAELAQTEAVLRSVEREFPAPNGGGE